LRRLERLEAGYRDLTFRLERLQQNLDAALANGELTLTSGHEGGRWLRPVMQVVAGPSGSGKSSLFPVAATGVDYFNVDDRCAELNRGSCFSWNTSQPAALKSVSDV